MTTSLRPPGMVNEKRNHLSMKHTLSFSVQYLVGNWPGVRDMASGDLARSNLSVQSNSLKLPVRSRNLRSVEHPLHVEQVAPLLAWPSQTLCVLHWAGASHLSTATHDGICGRRGRASQDPVGRLGRGCALAGQHDHQCEGQSGLDGAYAECGHPGPCTSERKPRSLCDHATIADAWRSMRGLAENLACRYGCCCACAFPADDLYPPPGRRFAALPLRTFGVVAATPPVHLPPCSSESRRTETLDSMPTSRVNSSTFLRQSGSPASSNGGPRQTWPMVCGACQPSAARR